MGVGNMSDDALIKALVDPLRAEIGRLQTSQRETDARATASQDRVTAGIHGLELRVQRVLDMLEGFRSAGDDRGEAIKDLDRRTRSLEDARNRLIGGALLLGAVAGGAASALAKAMGGALGG
jgi:hypothetical protein